MYRSILSIYKGFWFLTQYNMYPKQTIELFGFSKGSGFWDFSNNAIKERGGGFCFPSSMCKNTPINYCKNWRISTRECTSILGFGSYPLKLTYEIRSKFCLRFPPIFMPRATKFPSFISLHHKISESESIKMSDDSDSDFGFGSSSPFLDDDEPSTTTQESVVDSACG